MANQFLTKRVAKATLDITANYAASVTNSGGEFGPTDIDATANTLTIEDHIFKTGDLVSCITATGGTIATAPAAGTAYYIIVVDKDTVSLATSLLLARAGTATSLTVGAAAGLQYLVKDSFGAISLDTLIPSGSLITNAFIDVTDTFESDTVIGSLEDTATLALSIEGADDLVVAIAINDGTNVWDAGIQGTITGKGAVSGNAATNAVYATLDANAIVKTTADRDLTLTVAVGTLVGGTADFYVEYYA